MSSKNNVNKKNSILLFLLWPFFALVYAIRNYKASWAKDIVWFFVIFYGFTMTIHNDPNSESTADANRYRDKFTMMAARDITWEELTATFYDTEEQSLDIIEAIIIFLLSRVTANTNVLFAVFGLIFGYFYSRNIWFLIDRVRHKIVPANIPIIVTFAFIVGISGINGFRFWTATHMFLFGVLPFLFSGKKKYLWVSALAVLMHFSFLLPLGILGIYLLAGNRTILYFVILITTFFIKELDLTQVGDFLTINLPDIFLPKVKSYTNVDYAEGLQQQLINVNWYVKLYSEALKWSVVIFLIVIFITGQKFLSKNRNYNSLFSFTLLFYSVANILSLVPSGDRFLSLSNLFAVALIFFYVQFAPRGKALKRLIPVAVPALALFSIVSIRIAFDFMGFFSVFGNPLLSMVFNVDITLIEIVKGILY